MTSHPPPQAVEKHPDGSQNDTPTEDPEKQTGPDEPNFASRLSEGKSDSMGSAPQPSEEYIECPGRSQYRFNWSESRKWLITVVACFITFIVGINGTAITTAATQINERFNVSDASFPNSYWPITSWTVAAGIFPLAGLPLMETFGLRYGYLAAYCVFVVFIIPQAVCQNYATLIVSRVFSGGCAGILQNIAGGIVSDIWRGEGARSTPTALFIWAYLAGTTIGPVIGGAILKYLYWRWILYIQLIFYGAFFPLIYTVIPEIRAAVILSRRAAHLRHTTRLPYHTPDDLTHTSLSTLVTTAICRPLRMLCTEYVVFSITLWSAFCFGNCLLFTQSVGTVFTTLYSFTSPQTGFVQSALVIGITLGFLASLPHTRIYLRTRARNPERPNHPIPEARLYLSIPGSFVGLAGGFFWYAWTSYPFLPWILPAIGLGLVGFGIFTVVCAASNYLEDAYEKYAASAMAAVAFGENLFAGFLPLAEAAMYERLGLNWASCLLAFLGLALSAAPVVLVVKGRGLRARSPFMGESLH
ncbi:MFS general substrate transporter [Saccharata proteae CBS 121410]|uniref:MFS general substrate transporter n=1 Tax=Saccharata proteae CBS 121410 TaxID=1314787 RepID=A0A9P4HLY7_9PEZI|nr:MFS general substrate transporter [Saccharata proteae CBS 121410]